MKGVVVIGATGAGLALAQQLAAAGIEVQVWSHRSLDDLEHAPARAITQITLPSARRLEVKAGIDAYPWLPGVHSDLAEWNRIRMDFVSAPGEEPKGFTARLSGPALAVDERLKAAEQLARLDPKLQGTSAPGTARAVRTMWATQSEVEWFATRGYTVVVTEGGGPLAKLFDPDPDHAPASTAARTVTQVYAYGMEPMMRGAHVITTPEGEIMVLPTHTNDRGLALSIAAISRPGRGLDCHTTALHKDKTNVSSRPRDLINTLLERLIPWMPSLARRANAAKLDENSVVSTIVEPAARRPVGEPGEGGWWCAGIGEAISTVDPASAQGVAAQIRSAHSLGEEIIDAAAHGESALTPGRVEDAHARYWDSHGAHAAGISAGVAQYWSPQCPAELKAMVERAQTDPSAADAWAAAFDDPALLQQLANP